MELKAQEKSKFEIGLTGLNHQNCVKILDGFILKTSDSDYAVTVMEKGYKLKEFID